MPAKNPWSSGSWGNYCGVDDRMHCLRCTVDIERIRAMIAWPSTQKTVRLAAERRLRKLLKLPGAPARAASQAESRP